MSELNTEMRRALDALAAAFPVEDVSDAPWVVERGSIAWMVREGEHGPQVGNFILEADARWVAAVRNGAAASPLDAADRALAVPHREDDEACGCDDCMDYGAEDVGAAWHRLTPARRIALRVLDSGDDRFAPIVRAIREHDAAYAETSEHGGEA